MITLSIPGAAPPGSRPSAVAARHHKLIAGGATLLVVVSFMAFLVVSAWPPAWISRPLSDGTPVTWALAIGLGLPVVYFLVVVGYILHMNRQALQAASIEPSGEGTRHGQ